MRIQTRTRTAFVLTVVSLLAIACTEGETKTYKLYFLGGQSNMVGYGYVAELTPDLNNGVDRVMIFEGRSAFDGEAQGGQGVWSPLRPGFGHGFDTDSRTIRLSDRFGPELSFGLALSSKLPDTGIALVKYALGGSRLAPGVGRSNWHPTIRGGHQVNQFDHAIETLRNALSDRDIDGDGIRDKLVPAGIVWMHGESDADDSQAAADAYDENLAQLVHSLRTALGDENLPVVIGKITDSGMADDGSVMDYIDMVQRGQASFAAADHCAELVSETDNLSYRDDEYHYDTEGFIRLGEAFAEAVLRLENTCSESVRLVDSSVLPQ